MDGTHVVTCFLRNRGKILLLGRSEEVGSYGGKWGGVAGHAEGNPNRAAREEIAEETGLLSACSLAREGVTFEFEDSDLDTRWVVHPYLFDCDSRAVETDWETAEFEWVQPTEILRRETVPQLWTSYSRVAPTIQQVAEDDEHGSAYISVRALEVLRDRAGSFAEQGTGGWPQLQALAEQLLDARPSMAVVANRVNRLMAEASEADDEQPTVKTPEAVERAAREGVERAFRADEQAAANAADEIRGATVLTLSRSGTVLEALPAAESVFVAESRPAREGVGVAEELAKEDADKEDEEDATDDSDVTLHTDAAIAHVLATEEVDAVVVGADAVLPDGRVVNKTGTRGAALAAAQEGVDCYAVAASDKVRTDDAVHLEAGDPEEVYEDANGAHEGEGGEREGGESEGGESEGGERNGDAEIEVLNPTFDVTPAELVSGVITERGVLDDEEIAGVADELRELAAWRD